MHKEFESAGAVCSIEESSGPQNPWVPLVTRAQNPRVLKVMSQRSTSLCTCCTRANAFPEYDNCSQIHFLQNSVERLSDFFSNMGSICKI
jgi:hypothetical protein